MGATPSLMTRLRAAVQGEVHATDLEAYRRAGDSVYQMDTIQERRKTMFVNGQSPWDVDSATQAQLFGAWMAYALQTLGDDFVEADYAADAGTIGYVPPVTEEQAMAFYIEVADWTSMAQEAAANTRYRHSIKGVKPLPHWVEVEPCPMAHLHAMVTAATKLGERAEALMVDVREAHTTEEQKLELQRVEQLLARGNTYRERAQRQWGLGEDLSDELHEQIEKNVKQAIQAFFDAGQLLAMPSLIASYDDQVSGRSAEQSPRSSLPATRGFDKWCLTDRASRSEWRRDRAAVRAIDVLWANDPDPAETLAIQAEIDAAEARGDIYRGGEGNYFCCPWSAIYTAVNAVTIGGKRIRRGKQFTFDVSAEDMAAGGQFRREILVANFSPTTKVDYCNPEEGGHDD